MFLSSAKRVALTLCAGIALTALPFPASANMDGFADGSYDQRSAVIFSYFAIGNDDAPSASVTAAQFAAHIEEITEGDYKVLPLQDIVDAFRTGKRLPAHTVAITFDGADKSVLTKALPLLEKHNLPFTVFIPESAVSSGKPPYLTWADLRTLKHTDLVTFGVHPSGYARLAGHPAEDIRRQINNSIARIRDELDVKPRLFAYPFGEYDAAYRDIMKKSGLDAAFGQQSGTAWAGDDMFSLPRFTQTEAFADMDRFLMTANALPLPAKDVSPADPRLNDLKPAIGFTVPENMAKSLKDMTCFTGGEKPDLQILGNRVEIRMTAPFEEDRPRINCTLPVANAAGEEPRWRWLGMMFTVPSELLAKAALLVQPQAGEPTRHARAGWISVE
ncbi:MAG: polysaccharide deacetylase [Micavibrio aeruginosavorus]|uniref:Polysaccharide deacetylase n=1 Tax=Micavibrio aeruginosavorus TaxID=349221 RepID=A0A2W5A042_9BACT|nr:MAG: polysaccharide deacetylase [Micavibrio aeruginosavorus]